MFTGGNAIVSIQQKSSDKRRRFIYKATKQEYHSSVFSTFSYISKDTKNIIEDVSNGYGVNSSKYSFSKQKESIWKLDLTSKSLDKVYGYDKLNKSFFNFLYRDEIIDGDSYKKHILFISQIAKKNRIFNYIIQNIKQFIQDENPSILIIKIPNIGKNNSLRKVIYKIIKLNEKYLNNTVICLEVV